MSPRKSCRFFQNGLTGISLSIYDAWGLGRVSSCRAQSLALSRVAKHREWSGRFASKAPGGSRSSSGHGLGRRDSHAARPLTTRSAHSHARPATPFLGGFLRAFLGAEPTSLGALLGAGPTLLGALLYGLLGASLAQRWLSRQRLNTGATRNLQTSQLIPSWC